jgi:hypothetical protein
VYVAVEQAVGGDVCGVVCGDSGGDEAIVLGGKRIGLGMLRSSDEEISADGVSLCEEEGIGNCVGEADAGRSRFGGELGGVSGGGGGVIFWVTASWLIGCLEEEANLVVGVSLVLVGVIVFT